MERKAGETGSGCLASQRLLAQSMHWLKYVCIPVKLQEELHHQPLWLNSIGLITIGPPAVEIMALRSFGGKFLTTSAVLSIAAVGAYGFAVNRRISLVDQRQVTSFDTLQDSLLRSISLQKIVNSKNHPSMSDGQHTIIDIPPQLQDVSDEVLLAKFTRGFYCGLVLGPERVALKTFKAKLTFLPSKRPCK